MRASPTLTGIVVGPTSPRYDAARADFNRRLPPFTPRYVVFCESVQDVRNAVQWAVAHGVPVRLRSGRHSYEAYSLVNGGVVVDVSLMKSVELLAEGRGVSASGGLFAAAPHGLGRGAEEAVCATRLARVGAGATLGGVYDGLWNQGRVTVPGGSCTGVGVAGLTLGGGFGLLTRSMGLLCDSLESVEMVGARGQVLVASERSHPDLFWACRGGGGGNFGVATGFTFRTHPIGDVTVFQIGWPWHQIREVLDAFQEWADPEGLDGRLVPILVLPAPLAGGVTAVGEFDGPRDELEARLRPLLHVVPPASAKVVTEPYIDAVHRFVGQGPDGRSWALDSAGDPVLDKFKNTSAYVRQRLSPAAFDALLGALHKAPSQNCLVQLNLHGGAETRLSDRATAYPHRQGVRFSLQYQAYWAREADEPAHVHWVEGFRSAMLPYTVGAYVNYCDADIRDWPQAYYGPNVDRLVRVKRQYDPRNVFDFPQGIGRIG